MPCTVVNSQAQVQRRLPAFPQQIPQSQQDWNYFLTVLNEWGQSLQANPSSVNVIPSQFAVFQGSSLPSLSTSGCTVSLDSGQTFYGNNALKVVVSAPGATLSFSGFPIALQAAQRWYNAFQIYTTGALAGTLAVSTNGSHSASETFSLAGVASWQQVWGLFDLRKYADTQATWTFTFNQTGTFWLDGLQMVAAGSIFTGPPPFGNSGAPGSVDQLPDGTTYARILSNGLTSGVVNTNGLVAGAATDTGSNTVSSATVTNVQHTPDGQGFNTTLDTISYTAPIACTVYVTVTATMSYTEVSPADLFADFRYSIQQDSNYNGFNLQEWFWKAPTASQGFLVPITIRVPFSMSANQSSTFKFMGAKYNAGDTVTLSNITMQYEVVKR